MSIFSKSEIKECEMKFNCYQDAGDDQAGIINIKAQGTIDGTTIFCTACYLVPPKIHKSDEYKKMVRLLTQPSKEKLKVQFKIKKEKIKDLKIDLKSLSELYNYKAIQDLELMAWGVQKK